MSQANQPPTWIIVGGASQAGRALAAALPTGSRIVPVVRKNVGLEREHLVPTFEIGPAGLSLKDAIVINCADTPVGDAADLDMANRAIPEAWGAAALRDGAERFIQISSFSVYGAQDEIGERTDTMPTSDYGRSKLAAERALIALGLGERLTILRVPIIVGGGPDKLAKLISLVKRSGFLPAATKTCPRSMISYSGLAALIIGAAKERIAGINNAADPTKFTPELLARSSERAGIRVRIVTVPRLALSIIRRIAPGLHRSLFEPSVLAESANIAGRFLPFERLDAVIDRLLRA